jgi:hypothetical protein
MSRASRNWPKAPSDVSEHLQLKGGFKKSLSILAKFYSAPVRLPRRALVDFRISGPWRSYGVNSTFPMFLRS